MAQRFLEGVSRQIQLACDTSCQEYLVVAQWSCRRGSHGCIHANLSRGLRRVPLPYPQGTSPDYAPE